MGHVLCDLGRVPEIISSAGNVLAPGQGDQAVVKAKIGIRINLQDVIGCRFIKAPRQVPIGMIGHIDRAGLIAGRRHFKSQAVIGDDAIGRGGIEISRISLVAIGTVQVKPNGGFAGVLHLPVVIVKSNFAAMQMGFAFIRT